MSAKATIWLFDKYNNIWRLPLFVRQGKIYNSTQSNYQDFRNEADTEAALKCLVKFEHVSILLCILVHNVVQSL